MKIAQLTIQSQVPFSDFQVAFTYPEGHPRAGQALDRVCLIGPNGVGKSSLLGILSNYLRSPLLYKSKQLFLAKLALADRNIYSVHINNNALLFHESIDEEPMWMFELIRDQTFTMAFNRNYERHCIGHEEDPVLYDTLWFDNNGSDIVLHQPADYGRDRTIGLTDAPPTKSHEAESYQETFPLFGDINPERTTEFWALLIFLIQKREKAYREWMDRPEQRGKPDAALRAAFAAQYPEVPAALAEVWDPVLAHLGMAVDVAGASLPGSIRDKLGLFIQHKASGQRVEYGNLGTGLRRLLFNLGHMWALTHGRELKHAFCILEEPEAGLHPVLQNDLVARYAGLVPGAQLFVSTHSPLVAAAFDPAERLIMSRDARGQVALRHSTCPADADAATILAHDFV